jgi:hypothetical protein
MFGFSGYSELSLSQSKFNYVKFVVLGSSLLTFTPGTLDYKALAFVNNPSVSSSFSVNAFGLADAQATADVLGLLAQSSINGFTSVTGLANTTPSAATASFIADDVSVSSDSSIVIVSNQASFSNAGVDFTADANITTDSISSLGIVEELDSTLTADVPLASIPFSIFAEDVTVKVNASTRPNTINVSASLSISDILELKGTANADPTFVSGTFGTEDVTPKAAGNTSLDDLLLDSTLSLPDRPTAETFDFNAYADLYSRNRTVYIVSYDQGNTVHIHPENRTVYVDKDTQSYTVYIAA